MKKIELIEALQHTLVSGFPSGEELLKYDARVLASKISIVYDSVLLEIYKNVKNSRDFHVFDNYVYSYTTEVYYDEDRGEYYSEIIHGIAGIPNNIAVRKIRPKKSPKTQIEIMPMDSLSVYSGLRSSALIDMAGAYIDGSRIYFYELDENIKEVIISQVISFIDIDDEAEVTIPTSQKGDFMTLVLQLFTFMKPEDKLNDNVAP